jgi:hypothetical protein
MNDIKLTDKQSLLLTYLAAATQEGLYLAEDGTFGVWFDTLVEDAASTVGTKAQAKAAINQLVKKRVFEVDLTVEEGSAWLLRTALGKDILDTFGESDEDLLGDVEPEAAATDDDEDLLGDIQADVLPGTPLNEVAEALEELYAQEHEGDFDTIVKEQVVSHTENYTVNEWKDADDTEWTETIFADGSRTLKRRRLVSEAWRTDYWGAEFSGDKERATTAKLAKMARAYGSFTHEPRQTAA